MKADKSKFDPEVYEFYRAALEGAGFAAAFGAEDIPRLREMDASTYRKALLAQRVRSL